MKQLKAHVKNVAVDLDLGIKPVTDCHWNEDGVLTEIKINFGDELILFTAEKGVFFAPSRPSLEAAIIEESND